MRAGRMIMPSVCRFASSSAIVLFATILLSPAAAWAQGIKLDDPDLARISDAILTGRVISIAYGRDPQVPYIYTYVTIEIDEHIKGLGRVTELVVKQLGGRIGDLAMVVYDQATFTVGEEVLLFLVERPRDGTAASHRPVAGQVDDQPRPGQRRRRSCSSGLRRFGPGRSRQRERIRGFASSRSVCRRAQELDRPTRRQRRAHATAQHAAR